ncbi:DUF3592 domain-containing protein [Motiliproteus sp. MSK22-1]|uniref:DUF3592 domain-containing protein n=1 Tax=Motiliproteus sp. MSK22-1 TaxID=1897630 RepID=UPI000975C3F1|nr:DUF3592 domain-containing protein [Motiliproteus sp. MSK22-1]OMH38925.1 hypothetical protein BGP75_00705 [Motiliproteus sp. MSK22-1]
MKAVSIIKYVFTLIGLGMLVGAFFLYQSTNEFLKDALTTEGTVVELIRSRSTDSTTYRPVVRFITRGGSAVEFTSSAGSNPPSYSTGETVEVLFHESSPENAKINGFFSLWGGAVILGGMGAVFFLVGLSILLFKRRHKHKIEQLQKTGVPIKAKFISVDRNRSVRVNGRSPYKICAQWKNPATSEIHIFESENIWFDPTNHINVEELTVLIERSNPKKYHVDISFLPKVAS